MPLKTHCSCCGEELDRENKGRLCDRCEAEQDRFDEYKYEWCPECGFRLEWDTGHWRCYECGWSTEIKEG